MDGQGTLRMAGPVTQCAQTKLFLSTFVLSLHRQPHLAVLQNTVRLPNKLRRPGSVPARLPYQVHQCQNLRFSDSSSFKNS